MSLWRQSGMALLCVCVLSAGRFAAAEDKKVDLKVGDPAPAFETKDADGNPVELTRGVTAQRWTFVIDKDGKIIHKNTKVNAAKDSQAILSLIEKQEK